MGRDDLPSFFISTRLKEKVQRKGDSRLFLLLHSFKCQQHQEIGDINNHGEAD
jgi:hypothetical protein